MDEDFNDDSAILKKILKSDMDNIKDTLDEIDEKAFEEAANKILKAKRIYILGMRSSFTIAQYLGFYLGIILDSVHVIRMDMGDAFEQVVKINEDDVLISQIFEGTNIEPRFFVPIFPIIFLNGSNGLSTGFKQCILPRNPKDIINYIKSVITGKKYRSEFLPFYSGFKGIFTYVTEESGEKVLECHGLVKQINSTNYIIEELPIGIDYTKYIEILEKLVEAGVIQNYIDKCNPKDDSICFEIKTTREFTNNHKNERDVLEAFKLIRSCPEQYNCIDENNRVREFKSVKEILDAYIKIRLEYYEKRKENLLKNLKFEVNKAYSKYLFIKGVNNETISIRKQPKEKIVKQLTKIDKIIQIENSYDYLFSIPIYSITLEKVEELKAFITKKKEEYEAIKKQTIEEMWLHDLENFQSFTKNK
jgi:DNA gyrase/topoisomerase IV subunit A